MENDSCFICYGSIRNARRYVCPFCENSFHREHFAAWVFEHQNCPVCRNRMSTRVLQELAPKTESEANTMLEINRELQRAFSLARRYEETIGHEAERKRRRERRKQMKQSKEVRKKLPPDLLLVPALIIVGVYIFIQQFW